MVLNADELPAEDKAAMDAGWKKYGHNENVNRMVSLRRTLPDLREPA